MRRREGMVWSEVGRGRNEGDEEERRRRGGERWG